ncbi:MAG: hydrogenase expression/formation protein HypE [Planctomycetota bacterium]|nr:MAG: hydrogenase expression/formation protein HypE [Planctomycetota bacterium]
MSTPTETSQDEKIVLAHGGGGELTRRLVAERIMPKLGNKLLNPLTDSAVLTTNKGQISFTTDAYVVQPLEFPGGDIGRLAVCGTVNDLAVMGAFPKVISLALVIEEGLSLSVLDRIVDSIADAAKEAEVIVATGDTKVIEHRQGDGMTITTAGVGEMLEGIELSTERITPGDVIIVTGNIADHGLAVMSAREGLAFETELESDVAPLNHLIGGMLKQGAELKFLRDPTRGGLAGVLADLAEDTGYSVEIEEDKIPVSRIARHTAELLGLDVLTVANEGKCVAVVSEHDADRVLKTCCEHRYGKNAAVIGRITESAPPLVELITRSGGRRLVQRPYGEELPRIC